MTLQEAYETYEKGYKVIVHNGEVRVTKEGE